MEIMNGNHIPAFGSWDCNNHLPFTQCFESAATFTGYPKDTDLYVAGDLYENNVVTQAMIMVPCRVRGSKKESRVVCDYVYGGDEDPAEEQHKKVDDVKVKRKSVDEDLYKISPELLRAPPRRKSKGWWWLFSVCMQPACVV